MALGWSYVILRVVHSFVQATRNVIIVRFFVFAAASLVLLLLLLWTIFLLVAVRLCTNRIRATRRDLLQQAAALAVRGTPAVAAQRRRARGPSASRYRRG